MIPTDAPWPEVYSGVDARRGPWPEMTHGADLIASSWPYYAKARYSDDPEEWGATTLARYLDDGVGYAQAAWEAARPGAWMVLNLGDGRANTGGSGGQVRDAGQRKYCQDRDHGVEGQQWLMVPEQAALAVRSQTGWQLTGRVIWHKCLGGGTWMYVRVDGSCRVVPLSTLYNQMGDEPKGLEVWNGTTWTAVTAMAKRPASGDELELTLRNGERLTCSPDHRWPLGENMRHPAPTGTVREARNLVVGDVLAMVDLPEPEEPRRPAHLPDDDIGWLVGLYVAEGNRMETIGGYVKGITLAGHAKEDERHKRLQWIAEQYDATYTLVPGRGHGVSARLFSPVLGGVIGRYVEGRTSKSKWLLPAAWNRSNDFLSAVLDGYLHGDGSWEEAKRRWRLNFGDNAGLAAQLRALTARLGLSLRLRYGYSAVNGQQFRSYRGDLRQTHTGRNRADSEIIGIRSASLHRDWMYDLAVADEPHVYALASGILTHNCTPVLADCSAWHLKRNRRPGLQHEMLYLFWKPGGRQTFNTDVLVEHRDPAAVDAQAFLDRATAAAKGLTPAERKRLTGLGVLPSTAERRSIERLARPGLKGLLGDVWDLPKHTSAPPWATTADDVKAWPDALCERLVLLLTKPGDLSVDPCGGYGSLARAADHLGRRGVALDLYWGRTPLP